MFDFRAWPFVLWLWVSVCLGCAKEVGPESEAAPVETAALASDSANPEAELPAGMDLEKGIPPWYVSGPGKIEASRVRQGINDQSKSIVPCNQAWDPGTGHHTAKVLIRFTIGEKGHISDMNAAETLGGDAALAECVVDGMRGMTFDPPPLGGEVTYEMPLYFAKR